MSKSLKTNYYYFASLGVIILTTAVLLFLLRGQTLDNAEARLISIKASEISQEISSQKLQIEDLKRNIENLPAVDEVLMDPNITEITRFLDRSFTSLNNSRDPFINSTLNFSQVQEENGIKYIEASLNIDSSLSNFFRFLEFVETTGFNGEEASPLMEIKSINLNLSRASDVEIISYRVVMRIYPKQA